MVLSRWMKFGLLAVVLSLCYIDLAWAQTIGAVQPSNWKELLAVLINTAGVMAAVQIIKVVLPFLTDKYGWLVPILAMLAGPVVALIQGGLAKVLGYEGFDFSLVVAALTGGTAVAAHQIYAQKKEGPTGIAKHG